MIPKGEIVDSVVSNVLTCAAGYLHEPENCINLRRRRSRRIVKRVSFDGLLVANGVYPCFTARMGSNLSSVALLCAFRFKLFVVGSSVRKARHEQLAQLRSLP